MVTAAARSSASLRPSHTDANPYSQADRHARQTEGDPELAERAGDLTVLRAWFSAWLGRGPAALEREVRRARPAIWAWRFGPSKVKRYVVAFFGGIVMIIGARLADGCTSGHAISGGLQLAVSSWVFLGSMFISGVAAAFLLFGKEGRKHVG